MVYLLEVQQFLDREVIKFWPQIKGNLKKCAHFKLLKLRNQDFVGFYQGNEDDELTRINPCALPANLEKRTARIILPNPKKLDLGGLDLFTVNTRHKRVNGVNIRYTEGRTGTAKVYYDIKKCWWLPKRKKFYLEEVRDAEDVN